MDRRITLESKIENLQVVEKLVDELSDKHGITYEFYGNLMISVLEGVKNAIIHGNKYDPAKLVELILNMDNEKLTITIKDQGMGFNYNKLPDPIAPENIEKTIGRGIFLMKHLSDQLSFHDNGSVLKLIFFIAKS